MPEPDPIQRILVPLDFSDDSKRAFDYAVVLARLTGASLYLLTVIEDTFPYPELFAWDHPDEEFYRSLRTRSLEHMERLLAGAGVVAPVERIVVAGRPKEEIVAVARQIEADLIVLARHGSSRVRAALMGSTTEAVLRAAHCGVLVLPADVSVDHPHGQVAG